jgi:membrane fusion protein
MAGTLFRQEVVEARRNNSLGTIIIAAPLSRWFLVLFSISAAALILTFLEFAHYTRRETVSGQLVPNKGILNITAPSAGIVENVKIIEGQAVKAGDVLIEIVNSQESLGSGDNRTLITKQLENQINILDSQSSNQRLISIQKAQELVSGKRHLKAQLAQISKQLSLQNYQVLDNEKLLDRLAPLASKGYVSALQIQEQKNSVVSAKAQYETLVQQQIDLQQQLDSLVNQQKQLPSIASNEQNDTNRERSTVTQTILQNEMLHSMVVRAPRDGVVTSVLIKQGQTVSPAQPLFSMLPVGSVLQAQFFVPSRAIGFIERGDHVVLRYEAFPYQKFGLQFAGGFNSEVHHPKR